MVWYRSGDVICAGPILGARDCDISRDDVRTRHYTGASGFVYAYFDIYWISAAIAAARVGWGIV
jgi:hypothetical protein